MKRRLLSIVLAMCLIGAAGCGRKNDEVKSVKETVGESEALSGEEAKYCFPDSNIRIDSDKDEIFQAYNIGIEPTSADEFLYESKDPIEIYDKEYRFFVSIDETGIASRVSALREVKDSGETDLENLKQRMIEVYGEPYSDEIEDFEKEYIGTISKYSWRIETNEEKTFTLEISYADDPFTDMRSVNIIVADASADIALEKSESELAEKQVEMAGSIAKSAVDFMDGIHGEKAETEETEIDYKKKYGDAADEIRGYDKELEEIEKEKESIQQEIDRILK